jgi:hypothetical protein
MMAFEQLKIFPIHAVNLQRLLSGGFGASEFSDSRRSTRSANRVPLIQQ